MNIFEPKHFNFLKQVSILKDLSNDQLNKLARNLSVKEIGAQGTLFSRLENEQVLYIVRYGKLKLELVGGESREFNKGDVFGEIAVINNKFRTGTIKAKEASLLFCLNRNDLLDHQKIPSEIALKIVVGMAKKITAYLTNLQNTSTHSLIETGENESVEFKSTLRYNLHTHKFGKEIEHDTLKTIAAFLNSTGGTLIVGVDDQKNILGLSNDQFKDDDHLLLHLTKLIQDRISLKPTQFVKGTVEESNSLKVLRVDVKPADEPAYVSYNNDEFLFVRTGPATTQMPVSEIYSYIQNRFYSKN